MGASERPTSRASPSRITTSSNSNIVVRRFSLSYTLRRIDSSRLARNTPIMLSCGFFSESYCKYFDLYSSAYCNKFWSFFHFMAPKDVTSSRCWCGLRHASIAHSFKSIHGKVSLREPRHAANAIDAPSLENDPKLLILTSSPMYPDASQYISYSVRKVSMFLLSLVSHVVGLGTFFMYVGLDPSDDELLPLSGVLG